MRTLLLFLVCGYLSAAPKAQPVAYITSDPSGACTVGVSMQYNSANGRLWGCQASTWALSSGTGSGGSVFSGSTAVNPGACGATPSFNLAAISSQSPTRFECTLGANATVTILNPSKGAKFSIAFMQDGTGTRTVTYSGTVSNTCTVDPTAAVTTTQQFEVGADGVTINGTGCTSTGTGSTIQGTLAITSLQTTGSAGSKKVVCVDTATGIMYASSTGTDCSN